ncbi:MAG: D-alanine--D-alanine ligase [Clostridia bacterium]|nr:D-alanine--D-alanine ligase [Clostridia bacterium]
MKKMLILFGGESTEHEVSRNSAFNVINAVDTDKFDVIVVGITKDGNWYLCDCQREMIKDGSWENVCKKEVVIAPGKGGITILSDDKSEFVPVDICFPVVHGTNCEDGSLQGLLKLAHIKYVGCQVLSSAVCMDKDITKIILEKNNIPQTPYVVLFEGENKTEEIEEKLGYPCFVKPVNAGSSIGAAKASGREELIKNIENAFKFDKKVMVEKFINCRELEVAVMGNEELILAGPGEIVSDAETYDYDTKYVTNSGVSYDIPANIPAEMFEKIREYAKKAYKVLECSGLSRIDFFLDKDTGEIYLNEINTLPGFTNISMYPKLFISTGITYSDIITKLAELGENVK